MTPEGHQGPEFPRVVEDEIRERIRCGEINIDEVLNNGHLHVGKNQTSLPTLAAALETVFLEHSNNKVSPVPARIQLKEAVCTDWRTARAQVLRAMRLRLLVKRDSLLTSADEEAVRAAIEEYINKSFPQGHPQYPPLIKLSDPNYRTDQDPTRLDNTDVLALSIPPPSKPPEKPGPGLLPLPIITIALPPGLSTSEEQDMLVNMAHIVNMGVYQCGLLPEMESLARSSPLRTGSGLQVYPHFVMDTETYNKVIRAGDGSLGIVRTGRMGTSWYGQDFSLPAAIAPPFLQ